jgi:hypothetical protein
VPVEVQGHRRRPVSQDELHDLDTRAGGDRERGRGVAQLVGWNPAVSITVTASGKAVSAAFLLAPGPVHRHDLTWPRKAWERASSQLFVAAAERLGTMSSNRAGPWPASTAVRSVITVTNPSASAELAGSYATPLSERLVS